VLGRGERIHLVYNDDRDGDGIFDREEYLLGSNRTLPDTDGDELSDYDESKLGWAVTVEGREPYTVYSDPRFADIDGDFLSDFTEMSVHTDPYLEDTDGDGDSDTVDADPLAPPCLRRRRDRPDGVVGRQLPGRPRWLHRSGCVAG
jgi:hypothetical protein